jgi:Glycosyl transferase family 2
MTSGFLFQFCLTIVLAVLALQWAWKGFRRARFGLRVLLSWTMLAVAFPSAALINQVFIEQLKTLGISATGLLLAFSSIFIMLALSATIEQLSKASALTEHALIDATVANHEAKFIVFLEQQSNRQHGVIVIPAFNEEASVGAVVVAATASIGWPVVVIDDGSADNTAQNATAAGAFVVRLSHNVGVGGAIRLGLRLAHAAELTSVLQLDADGQHPPSEARELIDLASKRPPNETCLIVGSRFGRQNYEIGSIRKVGILTMSKRIEAIAGVRLTDPSSGFRLFQGSEVISFASRYLPTEYLGDTFGFLILASKAGFKILEVDVSMLSRQGGISSSRGLDNVKFLLRSLLRSIQ